MVYDTITQLASFEILSMEVWRYALFLLLLVLAWPTGKLTNYVLNTYLKKWAKKSKSQFDDILIASINPPVNMFVFALFFYIGMQYFQGWRFEGMLDAVFSLLLIIPFVFFMVKFSTEAMAHYLKDQKRTKEKVNDAAIDLLMSIVRITLYFIGLLLILSNLGYNVSTLLAGLGVGGLAFALAAQDILKNFFSGVALIFDKTFNKGEWITFGAYTGFVEELKLRSTKIRTFDGSLLTVPNSTLASDVVENVSETPKFKVSMTVGLTYNTSAKKLKEAKQIIEKAITADEHADKENIWIYFDSFGDYSLNIKVFYFAKDLDMTSWPDRVYFKERINFSIKEGLEKAGIEMAYPTQTVEVKNLK